MDKLSEFNNGVKYLLVCVNVFSRFVRVQPMKTKCSKDALSAFKKMLRKNNIPKKVWVDPKQSLVANFGNFEDKRKLKFIQREVKQKLP